MAKERIKIGLVFTTDFRGFPPGGGQPTVEIFLKLAEPYPFDVWLLGASTRPDEPVGQLGHRRIHGRDYPFIPLLRLDAEKDRDRKPRVPIRVQALAAYVWRRKLVESLKFDILYLHEPQAFPFLWPKRQPVLYHIHGTQESAAEFSRYALIRTKPFLHFYRKAIFAMFRRIDEFIAIDEESYGLYTKLMPDRRDRFHLLPTAIDVEEFRPLRGTNRRELRQQFRLPESGPLVLYVGRLSWKKGVDLAIRGFALAAERNPDISLAVAGDGEDSQMLKDLARELGLSGRIFFLGPVPHLPDPALPRLYNCADVTVVGSFHESLALVITEALACGVPVVSTTVGIAPKVVHDGKTGFLLKTRDPKEMAARITQAIALRPTAGPDCVSAAADYALTSKQICRVIEQMAGLPASETTDHLAAV